MSAYDAYVKVWTSPYLDSLSINDLPRHLDLPRHQQGLKWSLSTTIEKRENKASYSEKINKVHSFNISQLGKPVGTKLESLCATKDKQTN